MKTASWARMDEHGWKEFCLEEHFSMKSPCPNYLQFWQESGSLNFNPHNRDKMEEKNLKLRSFSFPFWSSPTQADVAPFGFSFIFWKTLHKRVKEPAFWLWLDFFSLSWRSFYISFQIHTSHPCVFPAWAEHPCLWNGFAGHLLETRYQALQVSSS